MTNTPANMEPVAGAQPGSVHPPTSPPVPAATDHVNVHAALAAAQGEMTAPVKGAVNPHFKTRYADLADVVAAAAPALSRHGISYHHQFGSDDTGRYCVTILTHGATSTTIESGPVPLIVAKNDMQGFKSATTYAKRIGLESVTGLAPDDDDDGNAAAKSARREPERESPPPISNADVEDLRVRIANAGKSVEDICRAMQVERLYDIPAAKLPGMHKRLDEMAAAGEVL